MVYSIDFFKQTCQRFLKRYPIVAIYLFGSQARGDSGPLSDYDFAVLFDEATTPGNRFDAKLKVIGELTGAVREDRIDVVPLNDASIELQMKCISEGILLAESDQEIRKNFEHQTITQYLDQSYYDARYYQAMRQRILAEVV